MGFLGSKAASGAFQTIIASMPPHDTYIETHLGTGTVLLRKPPSARTIGIEIDPATLAAFEPPARPIELHQEDAVAFLETFDFVGAGRVLIYADPPYLEETRTSARRYRYEYTRADHRRLLRTLKALPAMVILSGYPSAFYDEELQGWRTREFQAMTRGGVRTEKLWMNFAPAAAHWSSYAGANFTDRQRIKRKAQRWAAKFAALPAGERQAVLAAILEKAERIP